MTLNTTQVATELKTDSKTLRKFFRSDSCPILPVGQGKRYVIDAGMVEEIKPLFLAWSKNKAAAEAPAEETVKKETKKRTKKQPEPIEEDLEELDDSDLTDDLEELEEL